MKTKNLEEVIRDLKAQCDSKASAVAELLEDMRFNDNAKDFNLADCADEVADMGEWGAYAAKELRGEIAAKVKPLTVAEPVEFEEPPADPVALAGRLADYLEDCHKDNQLSDYSSLLNNPKMTFTEAMEHHKKEPDGCLYCDAIAAARALQPK